jgi:hypothetical protein
VPLAKIEAAAHSSIYLHGRTGRILSATQPSKGANALNWLNSWQGASTTHAARFVDHAIGSFAPNEIPTRSRV